jgi:hypothetical protein
MREYFIARKIHRMLSDDDNDIENLFKTIDLTPEMVSFLSELISLSDKDKKVKCIEKLEELLQTASTLNTSSEDRESAAQLGSNIIEILCKIGGDILKSDYSNLILNEANLNGVDLTGKNFSNTSLINAKLYNVNFTNADFTGADLTNAQFAETYKIVSISYYNDWIYALYDDKSVWKWSINNAGEIPTQIFIDKENPSVIAVNSENNIALIEQGKMRQAVFFDNASQVGCFKLNDSINVINVSKQTLLSEQDTDNNNFKYTIHNMDNTESFSIKTNQRLLCVALNTKTMLTYANSKLKINNTDDLLTIPNIITLESCSLNDTENIIAFGSNIGLVSLSKLDFIDNKWTLSKTTELSFSEINSKITHLVFADTNTLIVVVDNEKMYIIPLDNDHKSSGGKPMPLELKILCDGMKIVGLKSEKEYNRLKNLIENKKTK